MTPRLDVSQGQRWPIVDGHHALVLDVMAITAVIGAPERYRLDAVVVGDVVEGGGGHG